MLGAPDRRYLGGPLAAALLAALVAGPSARASGPDPHLQPLLDGCQRHGIGIIALTTPEWVFVDHLKVATARLGGDHVTGRQTVDGTVGDIHPAGDDEFHNHDFNDIDVEVLPDPGSPGV